MLRNGIIKTNDVVEKDFDEDSLNILLLELISCVESYIILEIDNFKKIELFQLLRLLTSIIKSPKSYFFDAIINYFLNVEKFKNTDFNNEELFFELNVPNYKTNCCVYYLNKKLVISFDKNAFDLGEDYYDFFPIVYPDDIRFQNENFLILCSVSDYISSFGSFYQNKKDIREFVLTRFENDPSPVRILCSQELEFQLKNGKNPKDLLNHYIAIFKSNNGETYLRVFDTTKIESEPWYRFSATLFIISDKTSRAAG